MQAHKAKLNLTDTQLSIAGCSHIGGHKYAGVCIVYPQGDWYGLVTKRNAANILDTCVMKGGILKSNYRGSIIKSGSVAAP
ncbi:Sucraseferredoxin-like protein [Tribonema minus]|uniref:Sucraseferredoxin-like protein n=1 Tax=Tribonema minus TaxID=303371 RepID=A0A836CER1_9STRA|nr:Sucraseferredoxin-like protein [Tribonema minus]